MRPTYEPKEVNFIPPILRRKWIAPGTPKELGLAIILVGLAVAIVSSSFTIWDTIDRIGKQSAAGTYITFSPFRAGMSERIVGVYIFTDETGVQVPVRGARMFMDREKIPKQARLIWPNGRSQAARPIYEYLDYLLAFPVGLALIGLGVWVRRKRDDPFEVAMATRAEES